MKSKPNVRRVLGGYYVAVVGESNISTRLLADHWLNGEGATLIAEHYRIDRYQVWSAIRYELMRLRLGIPEHPTKKQFRKVIKELGWK